MECRFCGLPVDAAGDAVETSTGLAHAACVDAPAADAPDGRKGFIAAITSLGRAFRVNGG